MTDPTDTTTAPKVVEYTRIFDAPRELVFRCMIEPEHLTHFWGPTGMSAPLDKIVIEPRVGGRFETVMVSDDDGAEYPTQGIFVEVVEPERLVWEEPEFKIVNRSDFIDLGDGRTEVRIHQSNVPEMFTTDEAQAGFRSSLDRFATYLATL